MDKDKAIDSDHEVKADIKEAAGIATIEKGRDWAAKTEKGTGPSTQTPEDVDDDLLDMPQD
ncbi:hypothetical protein CR155_05860 [Pollutimonas nitritireducens]|uniref:Uncharacterized protein n=1 Tax=Pollutimonas nitritireducens TaxID=2045209 RepID=A0A2N4UIX5_9BURK|nr:hypothetical protein [Pollutimonas nitritireducens]PLC54977.1 hypothetical protein CR155_05860 [Pollutimonas nitritireducens]